MIVVIMPTRRAVVPVVVLALLGLGGCAWLGPRSSASSLDDETISARIKSTLAHVRPASVSSINVDTFEGTVYLSGVVDSEDVKDLAGSMAARLSDEGPVVNDLSVRSPRGNAVSARGEMSAVAGGPLDAPHPILQYLPWIRRMEPSASASPVAAYDASGRLIATIYTLSMREPARHRQTGPAASRPVDHVSILSMRPQADVPDDGHYVVLWHVSRREAASLR
jgi:hypothetical protein